MNWFLSSLPRDTTHWYILLGCIWAVVGVFAYIKHRLSGD